MTRSSARHVTMARRGRDRARRGGAFTLVELLIAVAAVALLAVAIAAVFAATGRTLSTGRRVSAMNAYVALIEQRLRRDFSLLTREGFLVIRNEHADVDGNPAFNAVQDAVPLYDGDPRPRPRRTDELMYFIKDSIASAREPLHPDHVPIAEAAAIYLGHGKRMIPAPSIVGGYARPEPMDLNDEPNANLGRAVSGNPNRYASEWVLLRHATLLIPTETGVSRWKPGASFYGLGVNPLSPAPHLADSDVQIALQPAASGLFRALMGLFPTHANEPQSIRGSINPRLTSGLVDIATTDLAQIRAVVTTADVYPNQADDRFFDPAFNSGPDGTNAGVDGVFRVFGTGSENEDPEVVFRNQAWMSDARPGWSDPPPGSWDDRSRIRCELEAPDYIGVITDSSLNDVERAYRRADQLMLSASNLVPRCTEFIVEWSFGVAYPSDESDPNYIAERQGELIWHGMERWVGLGASTPVARPYNPGDRPWEQHRVRYRRDDRPDSTDNHQVSSTLIHGFVNANQEPPVGEPLASYFGYVDPTFNPEGGNADRRPPYVPWAWPRLIRITLSVADPGDPTFEQTYQFVFEVPAEPGP